MHDKKHRHRPITAHSYIKYHPKHAISSNPIQPLESPHALFTCALAVTLALVQDNCSLAQCPSDTNARLLYIPHIKARNRMDV
jgi:hypothetical protein